MVKELLVDVNGSSEVSLTMVTLPRRSAARAPGPWSRLVGGASRPVDAASLAVVRIGFGLVGVLVAVRTIANGWVEELYAGPRHHFTYAGFGWVHPPSVAVTYALVAVIGLAAALVALGWHYRVAIVVFL